MKSLRLLAFLLFTIVWEYASALPPEGKDIKTTFTNPVIWSDVPDPDVIRVGDTFYLVSTTMHLMPGAPVMQSKDLVNWEMASYVFDKLTDTPNYDLKDGTVYGRGQWATSLRYHNGKYYAYFSPNDKPYKGYIYSATDPAGKWELVSRIPHFHDASLFFDDDGRVYIFYGSGQVRELKKDLSGVQPGGVDMKLFERDAEETGLLEGSRVVKYNGKYYVLMISWPAGGNRRQVCYRADKITGPYEKKVILEDNFDDLGYVAQGTIVDDAKGNWYGLIFLDRGGVGRILTLMPCRWVDGWPMLGDTNGRVPKIMKKPVQGYPDIPLVVSDDFNTDKMKINWQWNHNPVDNAWSLSQRRGYLRLKTNRVVDNLYAAPNTLTQRMEGPRCSGIISMDISKMKDGDRAGFAAFNGHSGILTIEAKGRKKFLSMSTNEVEFRDEGKAITEVNTEEIEKIEVSENNIYLRIDCDFLPNRDIATFYYSMDNKNWKKIGADFKMRFDYRKFFMGTKFAIFNYATKKTGGFVDIDFFEYSKEPCAIGLKDVTAENFLVGVALNTRQAAGHDACVTKQLKRHFNAIVAENCMKAAELHPEEGHYRFDDADRLVSFGEENGMAITGHCLIWHSQLPAWFCKDDKGGKASPELLKARMKEHIQTVVGRYKGRIKGWDVVNEAIEGDGSWRKTPFLEILGEEYIPLAFQYAHEADPEAELYYNDYGMDGKAKRDKTVELVNMLKQRGLRIDAVGMQGHMGMNYPDIKQFEESILCFAGTGVKVMITEWDMSALPTAYMGANITDTVTYKKNLNPYPDGLPDSVSLAWNSRMADFFNLFLKHSDVIIRVTAWGVTDKDSWKNNFPVRGRVDYPLLFDRNCEPKPFIKELIESF